MGQETFEREDIIGVWGPYPPSQNVRVFTVSIDRAENRQKYSLFYSLTPSFRYVQNALFCSHGLDHLHTIKTRKMKMQRYASLYDHFCSVPYTRRHRLVMEYLHRPISDHRPSRSPSFYSV